MDEDVSESSASMEGPREIKSDELLEKIRSQTYHIHIIMIVCSFSWAVGGISIMSSAFYDFGNSTMTTISDEFELPEKSILREFAASSFMVGNVFGGLISSVIADRIGRRPVMLSCTLGLAVMFIFSSFASNIYFFIAGRLLHGVFYTGSGQSSWVLAFECTPTKLRSVTAFLYGIGWVIGYCLVLPISMLSYTWREFMLMCAVPVAAFFLVAVLVVPESLFWLVANGRDEEIRKYWLSKTTESLLIPTINDRSNDGSKRRSILVSYISTHTIIVAYIAAVGLIWLSDAFIYFGLSMYSTDLAGDYHVNYLLLGLIELPGYGLAHLALKRCTRRFVLCSTHMSAALAFIFLIFLPDSAGSWISLTCWMLGKLAITVAYMNIYVMGSEIFPTQLRNSVIGICGVISRLGGVFAPYVKTLSRISPIFPLIAFGSVAFSAGIIALSLPETKDKSLDESQTSDTDQSGVDETP
ncbi:hypothetical protein PRIPAC_97398 [Pristionchus pacificus]|nr:hypothetical protein PRIPAC_97398 [Pristionchus pacificus]